jgi:hypothetical protein
VRASVRAACARSRAATTASTSSRATDHLRRGLARPTRCLNRSSSRRCDAPAQLVAGAREAIDRLAHGGHALADAREADLAIRHHRLLPEHALAPLGRDLLGVRQALARSTASRVARPASRRSLAAS